MIVRPKNGKWTKEIEKSFVKDCNNGTSAWQVARDYGFDDLNDPLKSVEAKKTYLRKRGYIITKDIDAKIFLP